jgi:hypothetical protein
VKIKSLLTSIIAAAGLLAASGAHAATWSFQPGAGHHWNGTDTMGGLTRIDGKISSSASANGIVWVVPVQLSATNVNYSGTQNIAGGGGTMASRLAVFDGTGAFIGATVATAATNFGTILVPSNGTLFTQHTFTGAVTLRSLRLTF